MTRPTTTPPAVPSSLSPDRVHAFVSDLFAEDLHAKRVLSLANGGVGVLHGAALGIHTIGLGLASAMGLDPTHTTKQVDRLLGNVGVDPWELMGSWVPFSIEENFRDTKDPRFGLGLSEALLTLLGAASERTVLDKRLYPGTAKKRVHSLFSQGQRWYQLFPTLREAWLRPLMTAFGEILAEHQLTRQIFAVL